MSRVQAKCRHIEGTDVTRDVAADEFSAGDGIGA